MENSPLNKKNKAQAVKEEELPKFFIGGLPANSCKKELLELLSPIAKIIEIEFRLRPNKKKCLGHGLITTTEEGANNLKKLRFFKYKGRKIFLSPHLRGKELIKFQQELTRRRLFFKNLPKDTDSEKFEHHFKKYGEIETFYTRGEPNSEMKIGVLIYIEKSSALKAYEAYRFGNIDFKKILGREWNKEILAAYKFKELKFRLSSNVAKRKESTGEMRFANEIKPGRKGYKYPGFRLWRENLFCRFSKIRVGW